MKLAVVGLGLIGGSLALDLHSNRFVREVLGVDESKSHAEEAMKLKLLDRNCTLEEACAEADLVVIATPVSSIANLLPRILDLVSPQATVTDVGSTKSQISKLISGHKNRKQYVASHPMAGTEFSGPSAAVRGLFQGKAAVICDQEESDPRCVRVIEQMYEALQMRLVFMNSHEHDLHAAYVSHLSHISSFVLANTVLEKEKDVDAIFNLASGGFESTVRLAKSSPEMWAPIFEQNETFIAEALGEYIERLKQFHQSILSKEFNETKKYMKNANEIRRILLQIGNKGK